MKFICAVSPDGYMAQGPNDDMKWTPKIDKNIFQLVSCLDGGVCLVSKKTKALMPEFLKGRQLIEISRKGLSLSLANKILPNALIVGGPELLSEAYKLGLINDLIINKVNFLKPFTNVPDEYQFPLGLLDFIKDTKILSIDFGEVTTDIYRIK
jgi:dihydrofolate reductase